MRLSSLALTAALVPACTNKDDAPKPDPGPPPAAPQIKRPVDTTPLPPLAANQPGATGKAIWATGFGGLGIDAPRGVAVAQNGEVYVVGLFDGETNLGPAGKHKAAGYEGEPAPGTKIDKTKLPGSDAYVVKLGSDGKIAWAKTFGGRRDDTANAVAVRGDKIVVAGNFLDKLELGKEFSHQAAGSDDLFVAELDASGEPQWLWTAGGIDSDGANAVAATPDGGWLVGGSFTDSAVFGPTTLKSRGRTDAMLIKLAASGDVEWVRQFGGPYDDTIRHLAVDAHGNIYVQGNFRDTADWGGKPLTAHGGAVDDIVLAKYDLNGDPLWAHNFGNPVNDDIAGGLAVDPAGNITMVGAFFKTISFGKGDEHTSNGEADVFISHFTTDGALEWVHTYGGEREDVAYDVAVDAAGNSITTGWFQNAVDFGRGAMVSKGNKDVFVLKLDAKGNNVWAQSWGDHDHDQARAIAIDSQGHPIVAGIYRFTLGVTTPALESTRAEGDRIPKPDTFVVKLDR